MSSHAGTESLFDDAALPRSGAQAVQAIDADEELVRLGRRLPPQLYLGTSSWTFPGWRDLVWQGDYTETQLARNGLPAYALHPLLRTVGIDRSYYQPLTEQDYGRYAAQVPSNFRFVVKAPALITDATLRGERGSPTELNPHFLDAPAAIEQFITPALRGLRERAGPLVYQLPPLPAQFVNGEAAHSTIERIGAFMAALPRTIDGVTAVHALELRNAELLTPRLVRTLRAAGARLVIGVHARMPAAARQSAALRAMDGLEEEGDDWRLKGPLVVRWNLHTGLRYAEAKNRYAPFDRLIDPDILTRGTLVHLVHVAVKSGQPAYVIANNKAEGSAPLTLIELAKAIV
jgi:uncharacterized protein YecE (DUF72 family)